MSFIEDTVREALFAEIGNAVLRNTGRPAIDEQLALQVAKRHVSGIRALHAVNSEETTDIACARGSILTDELKRAFCIARKLFDAEADTQGIESRHDVPVDQNQTISENVRFNHF